MSIVINGNGTVTGLAVGGLPDGIVDSGTLATNSVDSVELIDGAVDDSHMASIKGRKNLIINGAMQVAQRGTSSTSTGYQTVDRWNAGNNVSTTKSQVAITSGDAFDAGFRHALKLENTGAISDTAAHYVSCFYRIEAQDLAKSGWNYKSASSYITISFWVKSSVAGTYNVNPQTQDGTRKVYPQTFSLSADTWTKVEKSFSGHSSITFDNDTGRGMELHISPFYGTNFTDSGVSTSAWSDYGSATRFPDYVQNWGASTGATWEITGVQVELGSTATDFEHRSYGEELALCQRYYQRFVSDASYTAFGVVRAADSTNCKGVLTYRTTMRASPTFAQSNTGFNIGPQYTVTSIGTTYAGKDCAWVDLTSSGASLTAGQAVVWNANNNAAAYVELNSEL